MFVQTPSGILAYWYNRQYAILNLNSENVFIVLLAFEEIELLRTPYLVLTVKIILM